MSRAEGYAAIPNWMMRDRNVSRRAVLVYASLSSRAGLGAIYPSQSTIAEEAGVSERTVRSALAELEELGVVERISRRGKEGRATALTTAYVLHPNGRHEGQAESAGRSKGPAKEPATSDKGTGNSAHTTPSIEVTREEVTKSGPRKRGERIPEPFVLTAEMKAWAATEVPGLDVVAHTREFVDHWRAETGAKATKRDWVAAWRNWMRKAHRWNTPRGAGRVTPDDRMREGLDRGARLAALVDAEVRGITA